MAINFSQLPVGKPVNLPETGRYYATIENAEMKQPKDATKSMYLNLTLSLKNKSGIACGKIYDIIAESDKELIQYKIARFLTALNLQNLGTFELSDLQKIIKGKELIVDVKQEEAKDGYAAKAVVDVFSGDIYYPMSEASTLFNLKTTDLKVTEDKTDDLKIDANDAVDVHPADLDDF